MLMISIPVAAYPARSPAATPPDTVREAVRALAGRGLRDRLTLEVSGGVGEDTLVGYAATGVDIISMGALTHTVRNFDVSLDILKGMGIVRIP